MRNQICWKSPQINLQILKKSPEMAPKSPQIDPWGLQNVVKKSNLFLTRFRDQPTLIFLPFLGPFGSPKRSKSVKKREKYDVQK